MHNHPVTRREFSQRCSQTALAAAALPVLAPKLAAQNPDKIRLGLVGCGNRGTGAVMDAILSTPHVEVIALADQFPEKIEASLKRLRTPQKGKTRDVAAQYGSLVVDWDRLDAVRVTPERCFTGFDSCQQILQTDADIIILAGPPGFRPQQFRCHELGHGRPTQVRRGARWTQQLGRLAGQRQRV